MPDDFYDWLDEGQSKGWVSKMFCIVHDAWPMTAEENDELSELGETCVWAVRFREDDSPLDGGREDWGTKW